MHDVVRAGKIARHTDAAARLQAGLVERGRDPSGQAARGGSPMPARGANRRTFIAALGGAAATWPKLRTRSSLSGYGASAC
jgi:hypothetical protein